MEANLARCLVGRKKQERVEVHQDSRTRLISAKVILLALFKGWGQTRSPFNRGPFHLQYQRKVLHNRLKEQKVVRGFGQWKRDFILSFPLSPRLKEGNWSTFSNVVLRLLTFQNLYNKSVNPLPFVFQEVTFRSYAQVEGKRRYLKQEQRRSFVVDKFTLSFRFTRTTYSHFFNIRRIYDYVFLKSCVIWSHPFPWLFLST